MHAFMSLYSHSHNRSSLAFCVLFTQCNSILAARECVTKCKLITNHTILSVSWKLKRQKKRTTKMKRRSKIKKIPLHEHASSFCSVDTLCVYWLSESTPHALVESIHCNGILNEWSTLMSIFEYVIALGLHCVHFAVGPTRKLNNEKY